MQTRVLSFGWCFAIAISWSSALTGTSPLLGASGVMGEDSGIPIAEYVTNVFEDSKGHLWLSTIAKGVARYDGQTLKYFSEAAGLAGPVATSIVEDSQGHLWIGTNRGLSKYDGRKFINFGEPQGLSHPRVSALVIDPTGTFWVGTWGGVFRFDGKTFTPFPLPKPAITLKDYQSTMGWITEITLDRQGNLWFGRDGYGATKYDGKTFTHFTKKDGLASNNVQVITEDDRGYLWFGSRVTEKDHPDPQLRTGDGGLSRYDGRGFKRFPGMAGLSRNDIYAISKDRAGHLWIGANGVGLYRYDGSQFTLFKGRSIAGKELPGFGLQTITEDRNGTLWLAMSGGLFRLQGKTIMHVSQTGPWK